MRVALIEIGGSHDECLYSQIRFLKAKEGLHLTLICNESLRDNIRYFDGPDEIEYVKIRNDKLPEWVDIFKLWNKLRKGKYEHLIFNTAQGGIIKKLLLLPFGGKMRISGTLHNISKLEGSTGQQLISGKMDQYFLLNDYLLDNVRDELVQKSNISTYYPIFFPDYPQLSFPKEKNEIWICVPGQVEFKRRDYESVLDSIEKYGVEPNMRFLLLGRCAHSHGDGKWIKDRIHSLGVGDQFMLWDDFIDPVEFYNRVRYSDYIMPLIHSDHASYDLYSQQISGAFNLGFGYKKPFLMEDVFKQYADFENNAIFYSPDNLMKVVNELGTPDFSEYYIADKWTFDYQKEQYLQKITS